MPVPAVVVAPGEVVSPETVVPGVVVGPVVVDATVVESVDDWAAAEARIRKTKKRFLSIPSYSFSSLRVPFHLNTLTLDSATLPAF